MEWAKGVVTSPIRLMERVGEYVADRVVGSPHPSADPAATEQVEGILGPRQESPKTSTVAFMPMQRSSVHVLSKGAWQLKIGP